MNRREDARQDKLKLVLIKEYLVYRTHQLQLCNFFSIQIQHCSWCWRFTWSQILLLHFISFLQILWWSWELHLTIGGETLTTEQHVIWLLAVNFQIWYEILGYIKIFQTYFNGQHTLIHIMWQGKATLKTLHINSKVCFIYLLICSPSLHSEFHPWGSSREAFESLDQNLKFYPLRKFCHFS